MREAWMTNSGHKMRFGLIWYCGAPMESFEEPIKWRKSLNEQKNSEVPEVTRPVKVVFSLFSQLEIWTLPRNPQKRATALSAVNKVKHRAKAEARKCMFCWTVFILGSEVDLVLFSASPLRMLFPPPWRAQAAERCVRPTPLLSARIKQPIIIPLAFPAACCWIRSPSLWGNSGLDNNINANISYCWRAGGSILGSVWHSYDCCNWTRNLKHVNQPPHRVLLKATVPLKRVSLHCISQDTLTLWRYAITVSDTFYKEYVSNSHIYWSEDGKMGRRDFQT